MPRAYLLSLGCNTGSERDARPFVRFDETLLLDLLPELTAAGFDTLVVGLAEGVLYDIHPELAVEGAWEPDRLRSLLSRIRAAGLEPIPLLDFSAARDEWLGEYGRMVSTLIWQRVAAELIAEAVRLFEMPAFVHLGLGDEEPETQTEHLYAVTRRGEVLRREIAFLCSEVSLSGARPWLRPETPGPLPDGVLTDPLVDSGCPAVEDYRAAHLAAIRSSSGR